MQLPGGPVVADDGPFVVQVHPAMSVPWSQPDPLAATGLIRRGFAVVTL
jgi:hypothetical protein